MATINTRIQHKREFELNWLDSGFIPYQGELIIYLKEVDEATKNILRTKKNGVDTPVVPCNGRAEAYTYDRFKIGDGVTSVNDLPFINAYLEERLNGVERGVPTIRLNIWEDDD